MGDRRVLPTRLVDLARPQRVHIIGIGGAGMSAIATVLAAMGHAVSGSDLKPSLALDRLRALGIDARVGHAAANVPDPVDLVVRSTAIPDRNPEVSAVVERGLTVLRRADVLASIAALRPTVAVAGTHGKTTTSSMLALVLLDGGTDPAFIIGGELNEIGGSAAWPAEGDGWFVVEADESDGTFLELRARAVIVTSIEPDHLETYGTFGDLVDAFAAFVGAASGPRVVCADDPECARLAARTGAVTYGLAPTADVRIVDPIPEGAGVRFGMERSGELLGTVHLAVPGLHNVRNAVAAATMAMALGVPFASVAAALGRFTGVARRFEHRGEIGGVTFIDDYAHLPSEVMAALEAAAERRFARVVCVFQPHRFSRTEALWRDFAGCFAGADLLVVTDIYGSGEAPRPGVSGRLVADAVVAGPAAPAVRYLPRLDDVANLLVHELRPGDLCLTLGAGDLTALPDDVIARLAGELRSREPKR